MELLRAYDHGTTPARWTTVVWDTATAQPLRWPTWRDLDVLPAGEDLSAEELEQVEDTLY